MDFCEDVESMLSRALAGDSLAWDALFAALWPVVTAVAASLLAAAGGVPAVEDAAQNTFIRLMADDAKRLRNFDITKGTLKGYVAKTAHNCAIDYLRSHSKHFRHADLSAISEPVDASAAVFPMVEEWEMAAAMNTLSPREREVVALLFKENLDTSEAAARLGVGADTVRSAKSHALKKLKKFFGQA